MATLVLTGNNVTIDESEGLQKSDTDATLACADYGAEVPAMVRSGNHWGCQFHPERSAAAGARILRNFLELPA